MSCSINVLVGTVATTIALSACASSGDTTARFCDVYESLGRRSAQLGFDAARENPGWKQAAADYQRLVATAPPEIKRDMRTLADDLDTFIAGGPFSSNEGAAAQSRVTLWSANNCPPSTR